MNIEAPINGINSYFGDRPVILDVATDETLSLPDFVNRYCEVEEQALEEERSELGGDWLHIPSDASAESLMEKLRVRAIEFILALDPGVQEEEFLKAFASDPRFQARLLALDLIEAVAETSGTRRGVRLLEENWTYLVHGSGLDDDEDGPRLIASASCRFLQRSYHDVTRS